VLAAPGRLAGAGARLAGSGGFRMQMVAEASGQARSLTVKLWGAVRGEAKRISGWKKEGGSGDGEKPCGSLSTEVRGDGVTMGTLSRHERKPKAACGGAGQRDSPCSPSLQSNNHRSRSGDRL